MFKEEPQKDFERIMGGVHHNCPHKYLKIILEENEVEADQQSSTSSSKKGWRVENADTVMSIVESSW